LEIIIPTHNGNTGTVPWVHRVRLSQTGDSSVVVARQTKEVGKKKCDDNIEVVVVVVVGVVHCGCSCSNFVSSFSSARMLSSDE
jgi:hypothetical protein